MSQPANQFFVIGAMKAGTTSLCHYLNEHPDLYCTPKKEPKYFALPSPTSEQELEYRALYSGRTTESWTFEGSTAYTKHPLRSGVPERIKAWFPETRLVYVVRDPIDRIVSEYLHNLNQGRENRSFARAVAKTPQYLDTSRYRMQIARYVECFPRDRILILTFEDFIRDKLTTLTRITEFLGVNAKFESVNWDVAYNESSRKQAASGGRRALQSLPGYRRMPYRLRSWIRREFDRPLPKKVDLLTPAITERLRDSLADDTAAFQTWLGGPIAAWRDRWPTT